MKINKTIQIVGLMIGTMNLSMAADSLCNGYQTSLFGNNVCVFDETQSRGSIQTVVTNIHNFEKNNEFGSEGYALMFQPGSYPNVSVPVGYYTQVMGLGLKPDDTIIQNVKVDKDDLHGNTSLTNFWRSGENFAVQKDLVWAVSQASPLRNIHVPGALVLALGYDHYASGGFLANSKIDGGIASSGQQQWITRNTFMGRWYDGGVWNMVFVGSSNVPATDSNPSVWANFPNTVVENTPVIQEKPYLVYNKTSKQYSIIVPEEKNNSTGPDWGNNNTIIPESQFVIVKPGMNSDAINSAMKEKNTAPKALIFTPGLYSLDKTLEINQDNTVVLGLGVPVLTAKTPHIPIMTTSAMGIKISGIMFEAGSAEALQADDPSLLQIGVPGQDLGDANSPTVLTDVYCRIGGRVAAQTNSCITINDSFAIGDNIWLWRADHGAGSPIWENNQSNTGLIVNGHDVTMYGLAVEHFQKNQVIWAGEKGAVYFYQSELPYDVPANFVVPASFKIADQVTQFTGYGFGIYDFFRGTSVGASSLSAIETPNNAGISFTHMVSVKLGTSFGPKHIQSMIRTMPEDVLWGPSSAKGISPYGYWKGEK
jgi:hypothetical protein